MVRVTPVAAGVVDAAVPSGVEVQPVNIGILCQEVDLEVDVILRHSPSPVRHTPHGWALAHRQHQHLASEPHGRGVRHQCPQGQYAMAVATMAVARFISVQQ